MRLARLLACVLVFSGFAAAQFTTVSGTVTDPNGLPYANGTISAALVSSASPKFTATNQPYTPPTQPVGLSPAGSFVMQLADNTQLTPGGSTWSFTVSCAAGCVPPAGGKGPVSFTVTGVMISGASQSITAPLTAAAPALSSSSGGGAAVANTLTSPNTYNVTSYGFVCNGVTDNTAALNTLLTTVVAAGGGTLVFPVTGYAKRCVFNSAEITLANNGDTLIDGGGSVSSQPPMRWTCGANGPVQFDQVLNWGGSYPLSQVQNACVLDLQYNATDAKLVSLGLGTWEIDHLTLVDTSTDCATFVLITNTQPNFHDNTVIGTTASATGGPYSCNDGFVFGGGTTTPSKLPSGPFQGYPGAKIEHNYFDYIHRSRVYKDFANNINDSYNTDWSSSGNSTGGAVELSGSSVLGNYGNLFLGDQMEVSHYFYGINIANANQWANTYEGISCSDSSEFSTVCISNTANAPSEIVLGGQSTGNFLSASDTTTFALEQYVNNYAGVLRWPGVVTQPEIAPAKAGICISCENFWADSFYQRLVMNNHNVGKQRIAALEEIPTTQVSTATDNFTRANAGTLGANWTAINSISSLQIVSNTAESNTTSAYNGNFYSAITFPNDQWSQCTISSIVSGGTPIALCVVRVQAAAESFYYLQISGDGTTSCTIGKFAAGTKTDLTSSCTPPHHPLIAGDQLTLTVVGSTLTGYLNGFKILQVADTTYTSGSPGVVQYPGGLVTNITYSGWSGGSMDCANGVVTSVVPGLPIVCSLSGTSAAFATATTAGTCVQNTTAIAGATTSMVAVASPVSTPGVGAQWSAFVSSAGNVTINECAVATSAGGTVAFNIRLIP